MEEKQKVYEEHARERWHAINEVMWCDIDGVWYDYDNKLGCQRKAFYPTNVIPLLLQNKGEYFYVAHLLLPSIDIFLYWEVRSPR